MARAGPFEGQGLPTSAVTGVPRCNCRPSRMPASGLGCCDRCHRWLSEYPHHFLDNRRSV